VLDLFRPFKHHDRNYMDLLVKLNPSTLLGAAGEARMPGYLRELEELSALFNGGGSSLLFEMFKYDFGVS
jgi:hypothetical protein